MVTLVALSSTSDDVLAQKLITFQVCALRDHVLLKELFAKASSPVLKKGKAIVQEQETKDTDNTTDKRVGNSVQLCGNSEGHQTESSVDSLLLGPDKHFVEVGRKCARDLLIVTNATEEDGWTVVGSNKGVFIMKKLPGKGDPPVNCVKGTMIINVPPDFLLRVLMDPTHASSLDEMMKEMHVIQAVSSSIQLLHIIYKAVWPTTARDFAVCNVVGRLDMNTRVHAACSIVDDRIPETKQCVRAIVMAGGYCIKDVVGDVNSSEVTYITQVDLKGSVPSFVVNKIVESQPQCVNQLRSIALKEYARLSSDPVKYKQFKETYPIHHINPLRKDEMFSNTSRGHANDECTSLANQSESQSVDGNVPQLKTVAEVHTIPSDLRVSLEETISVREEEDVSHASSPDDVFGEKRVPGISMSAVLEKLPQFKSDDASQSDQSSVVGCCS